MTNIVLISKLYILIPIAIQPKKLTNKNNGLKNRWTKQVLYDHYRPARTKRLLTDFFDGNQIDAVLYRCSNT